MQCVRATEPHLARAHVRRNVLQPELARRLADGPGARVRWRFCFRNRGAESLRESKNWMNGGVEDAGGEAISTVLPPVCSVWRLTHGIHRGAWKWVHPHWLRPYPEPPSRSSAPAAAPCTRVSSAAATASGATSAPQGPAASASETRETLEPFGTRGTLKTSDRGQSAEPLRT